MDLLKTRRFAFIMMIVVTVTAMTACSKEAQSIPPEITPAETEKVINESKQSVSLGATSTNEASSLENIATKDGEKYMDSLIKEDVVIMSSLMAHAENENTPETMKVIVDGFKQYFDKLTDLKLTFDFSEQNDEYLIENFMINGIKNGEIRFIPFRVKYYKNDGMPTLHDDVQRRPLYDSPLINQYPYVLKDIDKYLQAMILKDVDSLLLHLGIYNQTEETKSVVLNMLKTYSEQLDLKTTKILYTDYDEVKKLFLFNFKDGKGRFHAIQVDAVNWIIIDDWVVKK